MLPRTESISKRYPGLTTMTGGRDADSRDSRMLVFWANAPIGKQEAAVVEATPAMNRLRDNRLLPVLASSFSVRTFSPVGETVPCCPQSLGAVKTGMNPRERPEPAIVKWSPTASLED